MRPRIFASRDGRTAAQGLLTLAGLIGASIIVYWPLLSTGLFADDYVIIEAAREGRLTVWRNSSARSSSWSGAR